MQPNHVFGAAESLAVEERPEKALGRKDSATTKKLEAAPSRPPLPALTSLRFFAAAAVVAYHWDWGKLREILVISGLTSAGPEAVLFFFVLSGFILSYVYSRSPGQKGLTVRDVEFWKARAARIVPVYYVGLLLSMPTLFYSVFVARIASTQDLIVSLALTPLFLQAWWPPVGGLWDAPSWTLSVECFFYACFPFIRRTTRRLSPRLFVASSYLLVTVMTTTGPAILNLIGYKDHIYLPILHLPVFIFGMALGSAYLARERISFTFQVPIFVAAAVIVALLFGFRETLPHWLFADPVLVLPFGLLIICGAQIERRFQLLAHPMLCLLGEASYAMYILHMPLMQWWVWLSRRLGIGALSSALWMTADFTIFFVLVVALSIVSYLYLEKPMRRRILGHTAHKAA